MKKTILLLIITITLFSCQTSTTTPTPPYVIRAKFYNRDMGTLPQCICQYQYSGESFDWISFQDSCSKYNLLDTINKK